MSGVRTRTERQRRCRNAVPEAVMLQTACKEARCAAVELGATRPTELPAFFRGFYLSFLAAWTASLCLWARALWQALRPCRATWTLAPATR